LKTLRKKNAAVVMATQELSDFFNSPIRDTILSNCLTKILLPNKEAKSATARVGYEAIGLNERELEILTTATPKRHYYYRSPLGRRLFGLGLGPVALSFVAVSDPAEIKVARGMIKEHGQDWPARWLERRGLNDWATYWRQVTQ
jgi:type IV secretion system protein VirB4